MQNERPRAARRRQRNSQAPDVFRRASEVDEPSSRRSSPGKPPSSKAKPAQVVSITEADSARPTPPPGSESAVNGKANAEPFRELPTRPIPKEALPPPSGRTSAPPASKPSVDVKTASSAAMQDNVVALKVPPRAAATVTAGKAAEKPAEEPKAAGSPMPKILAAVGAALVIGGAIFFLRSGTPAEPPPAPAPGAEQAAAEQAAAEIPAPPAPETVAPPAPPPSTMEVTAPPEQAEQTADAPADKNDKKKKKKKGKTASGKETTTKPPATAAAATTTTTPPPAGSTPAFTFTFK